MIELKGLAQKITITIDYQEGQDSYSATRTPMTKDDALEWFEHQVLPTLGFPSTKEE